MTVQACRNNHRPCGHAHDRPNPTRRPCSAVPPGAVLGDVGAVAAKGRVIRQGSPGDRIIVAAHAEKAAKAEDGIGDLAAAFIDHDALDGPHMVPTRVIDIRAFHFIAADQGRRFPRICCHGMTPLHRASCRVCLGTASRCRTCVRHVRSPGEEARRMPSRCGSGYVLARAGDTGRARWLATAQRWEYGPAQTERGVSFRGYSQLIDHCAQTSFP